VFIQIAPLSVGISDTISRQKRIVKNGKRIETQKNEYTRQRRAAGYVQRRKEE
jgi:hypothetical protein